MFCHLKYTSIIQKGRNMKLEYKILICDDNDTYLNKLIDEINKANSLNQDYTMKTYVGRTRSECLALIQNNTYDIIILDICIKTENSIAKTNNDLLRSTAGTEYYGVDLYDLITKYNSTAEIFVVSNRDHPKYCVNLRYGVE